MTDSKRLLFVCGTPRSGTTGLAQLLNTSPNIVLGVERFSHQLMDAGRKPPGTIRQTVPRLFCRDRLFDFHPTVDNKPYPRPESDAAIAKYAAASYVGDKVPRLFLHLDAYGRDLCDAMFLYIVRNPFDVARSWQVRAENPNDSWPAENDHRVAVEMWNASLHLALDARRTIGVKRLAFVDYDMMFATRQGAAGHWFSIMDWLGLRTGPPVYRYTRMLLNHSVARAQKRRRVPWRIRRHVKAVADFDKYEALLRTALGDFPQSKLPR